MIRRLLIFALLTATAFTAVAREPIMRDGIAFANRDDVAPLPPVEWRQIRRLLPLKREYSAYFVMRDGLEKVTVELRSTFQATRGYHVAFRKRNGEWFKSDGYFVKIPQ